LFYRKNLFNFDRLVLWLFFLVALVQPLFGNNPRYYALFVPFFLMYIIGMAEYLLRKYSFVPAWLRMASFTVLVLLICWSSIKLTWQGIKGEKVLARGSGMVEHNLENMETLERLIDKSKLTATDICSEVAWYTDGKALTLPPDPDSLVGFQEKYSLDLDQIYLSAGLYMPGLSPPGWAKWDMVRQTGQLAGYEVRHRFDNGSLFLTKI